MKKHEIFDKMLSYKALAILRVDSIKRADEVADALIRAELPVLEISYTNLDAGQSINYLKSKYKNNIICGAGTVLDEQAAFDATKNGADFIIAPNYNEKVALVCNRYQIPYGPGCTSLSEAVEALTYGASFIKAFPISNFYGAKLVPVFKTPFPKLLLMASGGINLDNLEHWLSAGVDLVAFGSLLSEGSGEDIYQHAKMIKSIIHKNTEG
ncbi:bifunctional 4-hydroxy-2-oxoglutarate aldolase/2-dehydro-3-deoxy-phosphogluconate aldolase [Allofustis seminis]|uniref:bifunctional 4-hydroxy-2-oxoglutarate aldolase/2-dehydro-3-deoxy-phosphogluconate aldolase n=1 Tax=Allofustis seminis TaxID=166939 RepID=UPI00037324ED|nr:bifunctional 4-hydroxy-2-oxoglutarate aldolase/2-dehydro-3-deoxy-phosphogluconate aldolase [Allofustis seminis]